jgi:hypothetical protein
MPPTVDRSIAKMIATKRIITGSLALCAGAGLSIAAFIHGDAPTPGLGLALLIFFAGGGWTLRDGVRLKRELRAGGVSSAPEAQ